jgi:uroporphyrinogen III methyltransferase/synthase
MVGKMSTQMLQPLTNKTVVITRGAEKGKESGEIFESLGAEVILFPTIEVTPVDDYSEVDSFLKNHNIDIVIFSSVNAVDFLYERLVATNTISRIEGKTVVAIGSKTAQQCELKKIKVDIVPKEYSTRGIKKALSGFDLKDKVVLIPRSVIGSKELQKVFSSKGAVVKAFSLYNVQVPNDADTKNRIHELVQRKIDWFVFTSPSTFNNFLQIARESGVSNPLGQGKIAAIGRTTKTAIESADYEVALVPTEFTMESLAKGVANLYS